MSNASFVYVWQIFWNTRLLSGRKHLAFLSRPTVLKPPSRPMGATPHVGKKIGPWVKLLLGANFPFPQSRFCAQTVELSLSLTLSLSPCAALAHVACAVAFSPLCFRACAMWSESGRAFPLGPVPMRTILVGTAYVGRELHWFPRIWKTGEGKKKVFHCSFTIRPLEREEVFFRRSRTRN